MKNTLSFLLFSALLSVTACGPTEEERMKREAAKQAKLDSIREEASKPSRMVTDSMISDTTHSE